MADKRKYRMYPDIKEEDLFNEVHEIVIQKVGHVQIVKGNFKDMTKNARIFVCHCVSIAACRLNVFGAVRTRLQEPVKCLKLSNHFWKNNYCKKQEHATHVAIEIKGQTFNVWRERTVVPGGGRQGYLSSQMETILIPVPV